MWHNMPTRKFNSVALSYESRSSAPDFTFIINMSYIWLDVMREPRISHCNMQANDTETSDKI